MKIIEKNIYIVEIPHQLPASVFATTPAKLIESASVKANEWQELDLDSAVQALGNDRHTFISFDTVAELKTWCARYAAKNGHQSLRVMSELKKIETDLA